MKTTEANIQEALKNYRIEYQKAKDQYDHYVNPGGDLIIKEAKTKTFRAKILEQEMKNILNLIMVCNQYLEEGVKNA